MTEKELNAVRNKSQKITNILTKDFDFKWDWIDYSIEKWETQTHPFYLAEHAAFHMARKHCTDKVLNFHKEWWKVVDEIFGKTFIEYNKLTMKEATELAKEKKVSLEDENGKKLDKKDLIAELKANH